MSLLLTPKSTAAAYLVLTLLLGLMLACGSGGSSAPTGPVPYDADSDDLPTILEGRRDFLQSRVSLAEGKLEFQRAVLASDPGFDAAEQAIWDEVKDSPDPLAALDRMLQLQRVLELEFDQERGIGPAPVQPVLPAPQP